MLFNNVFDSNLEHVSKDNRTKTLNLLVSTLQFKRKPIGREKGQVKSSFFNPKFSKQSATLEELVSFIGQGQSITPAYFLKSGTEKGPSKASKLVSQQLWMVDIDNHNDVDNKGVRRLPDHNLYISNILRVCHEIQCQPFIIYETFSSTKSLPRFRVGFISSIPVTEMETRNRVAETLYSIFKSEFRYTDAKSIEVAQLFYGTSSDRIIHINYDAVFDVHALLSNPIVLAFDLPGVAGNVHGVCRKPENSDTQQFLHNPSNKTTKNKHAYITWGMKQSDGEPRFLEANRVPWDHLTKYRCGEKFHCEFHEDTEPSAEIIAIDRGSSTEYFYCCQSDNCECGTISQVEYLHKTQRITKTSALKKVLRCRSEVQPLYTLLDKLNTVRNDYPDESRTWRFAATSSDEILKLFVEAAIENSIVVGNHVWFPLAESAIGTELKKRGVPGRSPEAVHRKIKDFESYGLLIRGLSDDEMQATPGALDYFIAEQKEQGRSRHCKWWEMSLNPDFGDSIREATKRLRADKRRGKRGCITREAVLLTKGTEEADRLFNQDTGRELSNVTVNFYHVAKLVMQKLLDTYGWTQEKRILEFLAGRWTYEGFTCFMGEDRKMQKLREIWPRLLEDLGAEFRVINRGLRDRFAIPETVSQGTKIVYRRIEQVRTYRPYPEREISLNVPKLVQHIEGRPEIHSTLRERIKIHVISKTEEPQVPDTQGLLEAFEEWKWERKEQRARERRKVRELVIPVNVEDFDRLLRS